MGVELVLENEAPFIERWAKILNRWGWDIGQEAAFWTLYALTQGNLKQPPERYLLGTASALARRGYDDLTFDKVSKHHPDFIKRLTDLDEDDFLDV